MNGGVLAGLVVYSGGGNQPRYTPSVIVFPARNKTKGLRSSFAGCVVLQSESVLPLMKLEFVHQKDD